MKKTNSLIASLFCVSVAFGQTIFSETFSDYVPQSLGASTKAMYVFDDVYHGNANIYRDLSNSLYDLTPIGFAVNFVGDLSSGSKTYDAGNYVVCAATKYFKKTSATNLQPGLGHYSIELVLKFPDWSPTAAKSIYTIGTASNDRLYIYLATNGQVKLSAYSNGGIRADYITKSGVPVADNDFAYITISIQPGTTNSRIYVNGDSVLTTTTTRPNGNLTPTATLYVAGDYTPTGTAVSFSYAAQHSVAITYKQAKERCKLAAGWTSKNALVSRNNFSFYQGIGIDTISTPIPDTIDPSGNGCDLSLKYSSNGTTWTAATANFAHNFSSDSLFVGNNGTNLKLFYGTTGNLTQIVSLPSAATIYVDDITLSYMPISQRAARVWRKFVKWADWE